MKYKRDYSKKFWDNDCIHVCDNCEKRWLDEQLKHIFPDIPGLTERIEPGGIVPSGECPECGALTYVK